MLFDAKAYCVAVVVDIRLELVVRTIFDEVGLVLGKICLGVGGKHFVSECE